MITQGGNKVGTVILYVVIMAAIIGAILLAINVGKGLATNPDIVTVENLFVDINGDGKLDFIEKATIIMNTGDSESFLSSQLQK